MEIYLWLWAASNEKKTQHREDGQDSNRNYKKKTKDHEHFKTAGRKGVHED